MILEQARIFISYSHKDQKALEQFQRFTRPLERDGHIIGSMNSPFICNDTVNNLVWSITSQAPKLSLHTLIPGTN